MMTDLIKDLEECNSDVSWTGRYGLMPRAAKRIRELEAQLAEANKAKDEARGIIEMLTHEIKAPDEALKRGYVCGLSLSQSMGVLGA